MSRTNPAPAPTWRALPQLVRHLAALAAHAIVLTVLQRAERQARLELAALDDRTLRSMGLVRADLMMMLDALAESRTAAALSRSPWNGRRLGV